MKTVLISLPTPKTVQEFVKTLSALDGEFDLISGKYILDARSLMGIFTLDLDKPIELKIHNQTNENLNAIRKFEVEAD